MQWPVLIEYSCALHEVNVRPLLWYVGTISVSHAALYGVVLDEEIVVSD